jgi:hypothetical protein
LTDAQKKTPETPDGSFALSLDFELIDVPLLVLTVSYPEDLENNQ